MIGKHVALSAFCWLSLESARLRCLLYGLACYMASHVVSITSINPMLNPCLLMCTWDDDDDDDDDDCGGGDGSGHDDDQYHAE